ncbi:hypothetical protein BGX31_005811 [Mortierella sp. GBA43]|nr:hypothetical protein BGX31_005811 [Mortierella sp. GBA43]
MTSTTRTSSLVSPTATNSNSNGGGGLSTAAVAIIAVAATLFLTLSGVALVVCMRKRRHQRKLDKVLRTWNGPGVNQFSKVSTVAEDEPTSSGAEGGMTSIAGAGTGIGTVAGVTGMGIRHSYDLKPQPTLPQPSSYYAEDGDYGYAYAQQQQQQQQQRLLQQQQQQQGYDPYSDDDAYYNPYYASGAGLALGATTSTGMVNQSTPSFYSTNHANHSGSRLPSSYNQHAYQSVSDFHHHHPMSSGYIPPPPPLPSQGGGGSSSSSNARAPAFTGTGLAGSSSGGDGPTASALTSMTIDSSSAPGSPKRAPQTVMKQVSKKEAEEEEGGGGDGHGDGDSEGKEENNVDDTNLKVPV